MTVTIKNPFRTEWNPVPEGIFLYARHELCGLLFLKHLPSYVLSQALYWEPCPSAMNMTVIPSSLP